MAETNYKLTPADAWLGMFLIVPVNLVTSGFVLWKLWAWFAVPALHVAPISWVQSMGLGLVYAAVTTSITATRKQMPWYDLLMLGVLTDGWFLLMGVVLHALAG